MPSNLKVSSDAHSGDRGQAQKVVNLCWLKGSGVRQAFTRQVKMLGLAAAKTLVRFRQLWAGNPERK